MIPTLFVGEKVCETAVSLMPLGDSSSSHDVYLTISYCLVGTHLDVCTIE